MPPAIRCLLPCVMALAFILFAAPPARAETFLLVVTETGGGEPSPPPLAAREGIFAALFDGGHIAFEFPAGEAPPPLEELQLLAREAGAGMVALIMVDWREEPLAGGALRVSARGSFTLVDARTGRAAAGLPFAVGNEGRERVDDRPRLGVEIGSALIEAFLASSAGP